jgi:hypothetical protein
MTCTSEGSILRRRPPEINATIIFKVLEVRPFDIWTLRPVFGNPKTGASVSMLRLR